MKAILVVDIPDEVWKNKEKDLGMYVELWSERINKDWFCKYFSDSLKPIPEKKDQSFNELHLEECYERKGCTYGWKDFVKEKLTEYDMGYNRCIDEILGE